MHTTFVIMTYNRENCGGRLRLEIGVLPTLPARATVVVDDGRTDQTAGLAIAASGYKAMRLTMPQGLCRSLLSGIRAAWQDVGL